MVKYSIILFFVLQVVIVKSCRGNIVEKIIVDMPNVRPVVDDSYFCTAIKLEPNKENYIVGFNPLADAKKVHHILMYGCNVPGKLVRDTPKYVWSCGEMLSSPDNNLDVKKLHGDRLDTGPVCQSGDLLLFAWALHAPAIELPDGIGFKVGGSDSVNYIVLQVHYGNTEVFRSNSTLRDNSGIELRLTSDKDRITRLAGIFLLASFGYVLPGLSRHQIRCMYTDESIVIHPFRYRTHTHKLGMHVAGYLQQSDDLLGRVKLIGAHNPQEPQMFYKVEHEMEIKYGDTLSAYCDYNNNRNKQVNIGATGNDEMCNFYIMYWTNSSKLPNQSDCITYNPLGPISLSNFF